LVANVFSLRLKKGGG